MDGDGVSFIIGRYTKESLYRSGGSVVSVFRLRDRDRVSRKRTTEMNTLEDGDSKSVNIRNG